MAELFSVDLLPQHCAIEAEGECEPDGTPVWLRFRAVEMPYFRRLRFWVRFHGWSGQFDFDPDEPIRLRWKDLVSL